MQNFWDHKYRNKAKAVMSAVDDLESAINEKLTQKPVPCHCFINWQQCCAYDEYKSEISASD